MKPSRVIALAPNKIAILFVLSVGLINTANGAVVISSQRSQLQGEWTERGWFSENGTQQEDPGVGEYIETSGGFNITSTSPLPLSTNFISQPYGFLRAQLSTSSFSFSIDYDASSYSLAGSDMTLRASTATTFWPSGPKLVLTTDFNASFHHNYGATMQIYLANLTSGEVLLSIDDLSIYSDYDDGEHGIFFGGSTTFEFKVNPSHKYELIQGGWAYAIDADTDYGGLSNVLRLHSVPEHSPGVQWLALASLIGLARMRRCKRMATDVR